MKRFFRLLDFLIYKLNIAFAKPRLRAEFDFQQMIGQINREGAAIRIDYKPEDGEYVAWEARIYPEGSVAQLTKNFFGFGRSKREALEDANAKFQIHQDKTKNPKNWIFLPHDSSKV